MNYTYTALLALRMQPEVTAAEGMRSTHVATSVPSRPDDNEDGRRRLHRKRSRRTILLLMIIGISMSLPSGFALFLSSKRSQDCKSRRKSSGQDCESEPHHCRPILVAAFLLFPAGRLCIWSWQEPSFCLGCCATMCSF